MTKPKLEFEPQVSCFVVSSLLYLLHGNGDSWGTSTLCWRVIGVSEADNLSQGTLGFYTYMHGFTLANLIRFTITTHCCAYHVKKQLCRRLSYDSRYPPAVLRTSYVLHESLLLTFVSSSSTTLTHETASSIALPFTTNCLRYVWFELIRSIHPTVFHHSSNPMPRGYKQWSMSIQIVPSLS